MKNRMPPSYGRNFRMQRPPYVDKSYKNRLNVKKPFGTHVESVHHHTDGPVLPCHLRLCCGNFFRTDRFGRGFASPNSLANVGGIRIQFVPSFRLNRRDFSRRNVQRRGVLREQGFRPIRHRKFPQGILLRFEFRIFPARLESGRFEECPFRGFHHPLRIRIRVRIGRIRVRR